MILRLFSLMTQQRPYLGSIKELSGIIIFSRDLDCLRISVILVLLSWADLASGDAI
jgi:hypothetical protein